MHRTYLAVAALVLSGACYHATIETGAAPSGQVIEKEWANSFIAGLIPPDVISTASKCPNGVSKVETEHSFLNLLAQAVTFSLYSPMHLRVTCGTGRMAGLPTLRGTPDVEASLVRAAELSAASGTAVVLELPQ